MKNLFNPKILLVALTLFIFLFSASVSFSYDAVLDIDGNGLPRLQNESDYYQCVNSGGSNCATAWEVYQSGNALPSSNPQSGGGGSSCNFRDVTFGEAVSCAISSVINPLIALVLGVAVLTFMWGLIKYLKGSTKPDERAQAGSYMLYGILGLFVMVAFWGFVTLLMSVFFGGAVTQPPIPSIL